MIRTFDVYRANADGTFVHLRTTAIDAEAHEDEIRLVRRLGSEIEQSDILIDQETGAAYALGGLDPLLIDNPLLALPA